MSNTPDRIGPQLHMKGRTGIDRTHIVELSPRHAEIKRLVKRVLTMRDAIDFDHRIVAAAGILAGKFAEGALDFALARQDAAFENVL